MFPVFAAPAVGLAKALGWTATIAGGVALGSAVSNIVSPAMQPVHRATLYMMNRRNRNLWPEPQEIMRLFYAGRLSENQLQDALAAHGIDYAHSDDLNRYMWRNIVATSQPRFDMETHKRWWRKGLVSHPRGGYDAGHAKGLDLEEVRRFMWEWDSLPLDLVAWLWRLGIVKDDDTLAALMKQHDYGEHQLEAFKKAWRGGLNPLESLTLWLRGIMTTKEVERNMRLAGVTDSNERAAYFRLAQNIPSPTDLIQFSVKEAWSPDVVNSLGYDLEFPKEFAYWMSQQGFGWSEPEKPGQPEGVAGVPWPLLYWRSHWRPISPSQSYDMLHRLRPERIAFYQQSVPGVEPWTLEDVERSLKINDYPPALRARLTAISYRTLRLVDIRNAYRDGLIDEQNAEAEFMDRGYNKEHAVLARKLVIYGEERRQKLLRERTHRKYVERAANAILRQVEIGAIDPTMATPSLEGLGMEESTVRMALATVAIERGTKILTAVLNRAKRDYMSGRNTAEESVTRLEEGGFSADVSQQWVQRWRLERGEHWISLSAAKVVDMYKRFLLSYQDAIIRLRNLGLNDPEAFLMLAAAQQDIVKMQMVAAEAERRRSKAAADEMERLILQAERAAERYRAALRRLTPLATLKPWLLNGIISKYKLFERMKAQGYPDAEIRGYYKQWTGLSPEDSGYETGTEPLPEPAPPSGGLGEGGEESNGSATQESGTVPR
jgi:hypothetical protein